MLESGKLPSLAVLHKGSRQWAVQATWSDGSQEEVSGFSSETDANEWITLKFQDWLADLKKARSA